ncbi:hypothetical protein FGG79_19450 [Bacillus sp. BHET2]|uniref:nucleotidyltransferase domain-containing protein n=1 Tax=Bacillus sp. BHET2 TaxID=2583818 RepID=UPI00110F0E82|nr:nucleotidyltransferase domain-containing protein [Bacillus sp. BHET2]TMU83600.1 hypothetical protein FGG79_19450 [Bacillus sp. BHET2]
MNVECAGLESKHEVRDQQLISEREEIKEAIKHDLLQDENVIAFFYGGSMAKGNHDRYSDLDLRIVVKDHVFDEYRKQKKERAGKWGKVLFYEDFPWASHTVTHYRSFVKVDSFYFKMEALQPSVYLTEAEIVYDPFQYVKKLVDGSQTLNYSVSPDEFELWRGKFFAHCHEVYRRIKRGEIYYALHSLDMLRWSIASGWDMENGRVPNAPGDWSRYEGERSPFSEDQQTMLASWVCRRDPDEMFEVMKGIVPEFKRLHRFLSEVLGEEEKDEWVDEILGLVM